jgi:hypothetical protein
MLHWIPEWTLAIGLGLLGGAIRIAIEGVFTQPQRGTDENNLRAFHFGSLRPIIVGGAAGWVVWALATAQIFAGHGFGLSNALLTFSAGIAGTEILLNYINRAHGVSVEAEEAAKAPATQARTLEGMYEELGTSVAEERRLREENSSLKDENRALRQEVERLKEGGTFDD